jgi:NAD(P)-dependent dehydrogenase (short-subunit alcohol dehydrogenase family)
MPASPAAWTLLSATIDGARATFETNVFGALRIAQAFAPVLAANGRRRTRRHPLRPLVDRRCRRVRRI